MAFKREEPAPAHQPAATHPAATTHHETATHQDAHPAHTVHHEEHKDLDPVEKKAILAEAVTAYLRQNFVPEPERKVCQEFVADTLKEMRAKVQPEKA